ncbi:MAG: hypothetical protein ACREMO_00765 [Gemmatimonadales bacterium]
MIPLAWFPAIVAEFVAVLPQLAVVPAQLPAVVPELTRPVERILPVPAELPAVAAELVAVLTKLSMVTAHLAPFVVSHPRMARLGWALAFQRGSPDDDGQGQ